MKTIEIDLETRSDRDVTKCGVYAYVDSPYFAITLMSVSVDGGAVQLYDLACGDTVPENILRALATAGVFGNVVKHTGSISGAEVGCQGEIGVACAMAAAAAEYFYSGTSRQIEYAAESGLEHHLGLTCDPVAGLVQVPCIERNAAAANAALFAAQFVMFSDGSHRVSFDDVIKVMMNTGIDMPALYRETSEGGLAKVYRIPTGA